MKPSRKQILFSTTIGRCFLVFWLGAAVLTTLRLHFDLIVHNIETSLVRRSATGNYLLTLPKGYSEFVKPRPLLIFLHGAGELGQSTNHLSRTNPFRGVAELVGPDDFPFIVVAPHSGPFGWQPDAVVRLLDELLDDDASRFKIDPTRIYLTGYSMGGYGVWETAQQYPDRFAAVVPVAGGCRGFDPTAFHQLPIWAFHGELDDVIPVTSSEEPIESLRGDVRLTLYPDLGHDIAKPTYRNVELYRWLLLHRNIAQ